MPTPGGSETVTMDECIYKCIDTVDPLARSRCACAGECNKKCACLKKKHLCTRACGCRGKCQYAFLRHRRPELAVRLVDSSKAGGRAGLKAPGKGYGVFAVERIPAYSFVIEYVGVVFDAEQNRLRVKQGKNQNYSLSVAFRNQMLVIDARIAGNDARYINHSCDPNLTVMRWVYDGFPHALAFANRTIEPGEELTFDYRWEADRTASYCTLGDACPRHNGRPGLENRNDAAVFA